MNDNEKHALLNDFWEWFWTNGMNPGERPRNRISAVILNYQYYQLHSRDKKKLFNDFLRERYKFRNEDAFLREKL